MRTELRTRRQALQSPDLITQLLILDLELFVLTSQSVATFNQRSNNTSKIEIALITVNAAARSHP
jgi:hypothetical protein